MKVKDGIKKGFKEFSLGVKDYFVNLKEDTGDYIDEHPEILVAIAAGGIIWSLKVLNFGCSIGRFALIEDYEGDGVNGDYGKTFKKFMNFKDWTEYLKFRDDHKKKECLNYLKERGYID